MGIQIKCPFCGSNRSKDKIGFRGLLVRDVRSLGGNDGFEWVEVEAPEHIKSHMESEVAEAFHEISISNSALKDCVEEHADNENIELQEAYEELIAAGLGEVFGSK